MCENCMNQGCKYRFQTDVYNISGQFITVWNKDGETVSIKCTKYQPDGEDK